MLALEDSFKLAPNVCLVILTARPALTLLTSIVQSAILRLTFSVAASVSVLAPMATKRI